MGESTTPELIAALQKEGYTTEANKVIAQVTTKYNNFKNTTYPYGSEYNYDNTGEEAVYTYAKMNGNTTMLSKINAKTRACRGQQPVWYYYADPVSICGEAWWDFQYSASLVGYCMDDWEKNYSTTSVTDERLNYAAKIANIGCINSGQIDSNAANIGTVAWTYQSEKGNYYQGSAESGTLHNGWRQMSGEADLGLFGAIRILSSDVATDPIFGLFGYGCDVTLNGSNYVITPKDGVFKKLNLINEKFYMTLAQDQYTAATVATTKDYLDITLKNQYTVAAHTTKMTLTGLKAGSYNILVNNTNVGSVNAVNGTDTIVNINIGTAATYDVKLQAGPAVNQAPIVNAGINNTVTLPGNIVLAGTASDDGLPKGTLTTTWSLQSGPGTATLASVSALNTTATVSVPGTYVFLLTANDSILQSTSTVTITVNPVGTLTNIAPQGTASTSFCSAWESLTGLNDGYNPTSSNDRGHSIYGNWNTAGATQWVEYDFSKNYTISSMDVYWFADGQGINVPASCSIQYWNGTAWANVSNPIGLGVVSNQYNNTTFAAVSTNKIRVNITSQTNWWTGIEQWKVYGY
jgi:hypothetical protein